MELMPVAHGTYASCTWNLCRLNLVQYAMEKRWYKFKRDRVIAGVLSGLSWYSGIHPLWLRGALLVFALSGAILPQLFSTLVVAYIVAIFLLPTVPPELEPEVLPLINGLVRPMRERMLSGVCAGIANYYKLDVNIVRIATVLLSVFGGVGIIAYAVAWLMMPSVGKENPL
jgi:phage shock protein PspC (stress-responsive transcriptional regulator)